MASSSTGTADQDLARLQRDLLRPAAYPHAVEEVGVLETHISLLFFAGEHVYKVKKSVDLGFLDFSDLERRRHYCEEELRLNRRLASRIYLGLSPIHVGEDGRLQVGEETPGSPEGGHPIEWAVHMRRMPEHRMLAALLDRGELDNEQMNELVDLLVGFHAGAATGPGVDEHAAPEALRRNSEGNLEVLSKHVAHPDSAPPATAEAEPAGLGVVSQVQLEFLKTNLDRFLLDEETTLRNRMRERRIRDGHGDLHAGNLCFTDEGIVAYDCIEFSARFRCGDVASDLAFLAMDFDARGYPGFSGYLAKRYAEVSGDMSLQRVLGFYKAYRALVRAKVAALTALDHGQADLRYQGLRRESMRYVQLATAYHLPPAIVLMCGLPASGKSWLAKRLGASLRAAVLRSDVRRRAFSGLASAGSAAEGPPEAPEPAVHGEYGAGLYAPDLKREVYRSLLETTLANVRAGHSVIVDATFSRRSYRRDFVDAAERLGLPYQVVHVVASERLTRQRLEDRMSAKGEASEADLAVYLQERERFEPPSEVPEGHVLRVTSGEGVPEEQSSVVIDRLIRLAGEAAGDAR